MARAFAATAMALAPYSPQGSAADSVRNAEWPLQAFHASTAIWLHSRGRGVIVALIDSGVRASHADLIGNILNGTDFLQKGDGDRDYDGHGHGTAMASIIAAHGHGTGSASGLKGLAPESKILPIAIDVKSAADDKQSAAIRFAVDHGAKVINMSFADPAAREANREAITYASIHDVVLIASAGNDGTSKLDWPAAYPGVVAVGAVDANGKPWMDSNYGPGLTLMAPGVNIVAAGANSDSEYRVSDGTSDAAAYVSAEAALIRAEYPGLTAGQVVNRMVKSAVNPTGQVHDDHYGYGIIRPDAALTFNIPPGPPGGPLVQSGAGASAERPPQDGGVAVARGQGGEGGGGGTVVAGVVGAGVVAGAGGAWWMWRRRRKGVG